MDNTPPTYGLWGLVRYFLYLGTAGFGGPVALVEYMHRDLVEGRRWITEDEYREGLALANVSPGPLAAQLAIYLGYVHYSFLGATLVAVAFVLPSFLMVVAIGWAYLEYAGLPWMQAVFYGVAAAIIGIIAWSAYRLTSKTISSDLLLWVILVSMAAITAITETEHIILFPIAGLAVWIARNPRIRRRDTVNGVLLLPLALQSAVADPSAGEIFWFFFKAGAFVFGSGLAIVPFLYGGVVVEYGWLDSQEFLDAVA
ncbi:MAG TPA: chromate efflux transporter, partial [Acidimicrobiia bacterium]|nr:chromate efflux transporter [Acidimicrobiia bacterium]